VAADDDIAMSMIVVAEYMVGVELAQSQYRVRMRSFLDGVLDLAAVLAYDEEILQTHVNLLTWTRQHGCPRGQHDLIIAATAIVTNRVLLTLDRRARFEELPGLRVQVLS
jgi:tRNA(fMet)-specific endonuclease VapC